jgi:hypothetical protein
MPSEEYLTIAEVAGRLKLEPKTIQNKMASGIFKKGVHYFRPKGMTARFKWSAVVDWLENSSAAPDDELGGIPMARNYTMIVQALK